MDDRKRERLEKARRLGRFTAMLMHRKRGKSRTKGKNDGKA